MVRLRIHLLPFHAWRPAVLDALQAAHLGASSGLYIRPEDIPFFDMDYFVFPYRRQSGLGGNRTLRGYPLNRFVARTMTLANLEARYSIFEMTPGGQRFEFKAVIFYDAGNAYDHPEGPVASPRFNDYKQCAGAGLVIAWNQATIIHAYYGVSSETDAISVDFMHTIQ